VVRNADYWKTNRPYLEGVELRVLPDMQAGLNALETATVDWLTSVPGLDAQRLQADPTYQVLLTGNGGLFYYFGLDVATPELADKRVRQAFGFAMNRRRMVDTALAGFGRPASIPWPRQATPYTERMDSHYNYDLSRARELLIDGGWNPETILPIFVVDTIAVSVQMAEIIQADLASIGVRSVVQKLGLPDFVSRLQKGQFRGAWILSMSWMNLSPPTMFNSALPVRVPNGSNFESPRYQMLIDRALATTNDQELQQSLEELTQIILDEAFILIIAEGTGQDNGPEVARSTVRNATTDRVGFVAYDELWLKQ
jgi:peptide/nickel transport system substrate-binding protein